jgi:glyoxylase-like metal-dependent hydrolase (beta-lactamase superfamily II)
MPTPGHAPGQMAVRVRSGGKEALFIADVMHQPIQVYYPDWNSRYCEVAETARATRRKVLDYSAEAGCLILAAHFGAPYGGYVQRRAGGYRYLPSPTVP